MRGKVIFHWSQFIYNQNLTIIIISSGLVSSFSSAKILHLLSATEIINSSKNVANWNLSGNNQQKESKQNKETNILFLCSSSCPSSGKIRNIFILELVNLVCSFSESLIITKYGFVAINPNSENNMDHKNSIQNLSSLFFKLCIVVLWFSANFEDKIFVKPVVDNQLKKGWEVQKRQASTKQEANTHDSQNLCISIINQELRS